MKQIPLSNGKFSLVDDEDFAWLSKFKWHFNEGYARTHDFVPGMTHYLHELVTLFKLKDQVDHIDANRLNNQKSNLRAATQQQNNANALKWRRTCSSRYKGVCWAKTKNKWEVKITVNYKTIHLGRYFDEEEAARTYDQAAKEHFGEFARLNFPE